VGASEYTGGKEVPLSPDDLAFIKTKKEVLALHRAIASEFPRSVTAARKAAAQKKKVKIPKGTPPVRGIIVPKKSGTRRPRIKQTKSRKPRRVGLTRDQEKMLAQLIRTRTNPRTLAAKAMRIKHREGISLKAAWRKAKRR